MTEIPVRIPVEDEQISLEGLFREGSIGRTAIICHPHPLYGGNMYNNVVEAAVDAFAGRGWGTLRYNSRGVGASEGRPGQSELEAGDLIDVTRHEVLNKGVIDLAGYSYGSHTILSATILGLAPGLLCLFSPPIDFMSFEKLYLPDCPILITLGELDGFCSLESLQKWLSAHPNTHRTLSLEILSRCDHFYWGFERELASKIRDFVSKNVS